MKKLGDIGEDELISRLVDLVPTAEAAAGPGDDCAVVDEGGEELVLLKTDALVEGVHFLKSLAGKHLDFTPRLEQARWLVEYFKPTAMMDLSDGIARDLPRLAKSSGCGFQLEYAAIPLSEGCDLKQALEDGEDFELLFTLPESSELKNQWRQKFPELKLTKIGRLVEAGEGDRLVGGWDHFAK